MSEKSNISNSFVPSSQDIDYTSPAYKQLSFEDCEDAFTYMENYIKYGIWNNTEERKETDAPLYCSKCGSTSVTLTGCNICNGTVTKYSDIAKNVKEHFQQSSKEGKGDLESQRKSIQDSLNLQKYLWDKHLGDAYYKELCSFIREDVYTNSNFISAGMETNNTKLVSHAKELLQKAQLELEKACVPQHTLSGNVYAFVAFSPLNPEDFPIQNAYDNFKLGNFLRYISDDGTVYKLRLSSEEFSWDDSGASLNVEFTDVIQYANSSFSDIESLIQHVGNLSTSFDSVKKQAEQGEKASNTFSDIKNEGLYSALGNVLNARNQDVQITEDGITLRKYDYELDDYDRFQMKLINRNIVMTDNGWNSARMAIGLGMYGSQLKYGVWAELLVGDMIVGQELVIKNNKDDKQSSVIIDGNGIKITNGKIDMQNETSGIRVKIDPTEDNVFEITKNDERVLGFDEDGNAFFNGKIEASGYSGGAVVAEKRIEFTKRHNYDSSLYSYFLIGDGDSDDPVYMTVSYPNGNNFTVNQDCVDITGLDFNISDSKSITLTTQRTPSNIAEGNIKIFSDAIAIYGKKVEVSGNMKYSDGGWVTGLTLTTRKSYLVGQNIYIGADYYGYLDENNRKIILDGNTYIATESEASNCYIGNNSYNYGAVETYSGLFILNALYPYSNCSLQKLGRIVIFSVIVGLSPSTHQAIGCIPEGYRPSHTISISADNYTCFAECNINPDGTIIVSCSNSNGNSADYRIHGVWFWDADNEYTDDEHKLIGNVSPTEDDDIKIL